MVPPPGQSSRSVPCSLDLRRSLGSDRTKPSPSTHSEPAAPSDGMAWHLPEPAVPDGTPLASTARNPEHQNCHSLMTPIEKPEGSEVNTGHSVKLYSNYIVDRMSRTRNIWKKNQSHTPAHTNRATVYSKKKISIELYFCDSHDQHQNLIWCDKIFKDPICVCPTRENPFSAAFQQDRALFSSAGKLKTRWSKPPNQPTRLKESICTLMCRWTHAHTSRVVAGYWLSRSSHWMSRWVYV